mgnify:CR=1 FL=1
MNNVLRFPVSDYAFSPAQVEFLRECHNVLCEDDYLELLDAIEDIDKYASAEEDIQTLVTSYTDIL